MRDPSHILITGASSGIGAALAVMYACSGIFLSLHGRNAERLERVAAQARRRGADVVTRTCDVTDAEAMAAWIVARDAAMPLDLVVANAGISNGTLREDERAEQTKTIFAVNVGGVFNTIHPALPLMAQRRRGQIAVISSLAGFRGLPGSSAYAASKAAVRIYGEALRAEMAPYEVEVSVVCPGFVKTPMTDVNPFKMPFLMSPERAARLIRKGLEVNRARIAFPWQTYAIVRFFADLPQPLMDFIAARLPRKKQILNDFFE
jgi:short-subunit dehydrogenase